MTTDPFTEAARAEAGRRWRDPALDHDPTGMAVDLALWARDYLAAQEPTATEVEALARMTTEEVSGCDWATFGEDARNYHRETARRRLTAARAARRDEKDRP